MKSNSEHDVDIRLKKFNKETKEWEGCDGDYLLASLITAKTFELNKWSSDDN